MSVYDRLFQKPREATTTTNYADVTPSWFIAFSTFQFDPNRRAFVHKDGPQHSLVASSDAAVKRIVNIISLFARQYPSSKEGLSK
jgi:hypothetical protein